MGAVVAKEAPRIGSTRPWSPCGAASDNQIEFSDFRVAPTQTTRAAPGGQNVQNRSPRSSSLAVLHPVLTAAGVIALLVSAPLARAEKVTEAAVSRTCEIEDDIPTSQAQLDSIEISPSTADMQIGQEQQFVATGKDFEDPPAESSGRIGDDRKASVSARRRLTFTFDLLDAEGNKVRRLGRKKTRTDGGFGGASIDPGLDAAGRRDDPAHRHAERRRPDPGRYGDGLDVGPRFG